ncbi:MAG: substrate-binding domain-containing protein [Candidatus Acidiferrales bacterium]
MKSTRDDNTPETNRKADKYLVPIVAKTIDLLDCFKAEGESLSLKEIIERTGLPHTTAYRILHTLVAREYLNQSGHLYRLNQLRRRLKFGFANLSMHISLAVDIKTSLEKAAAAAGVDLLVWDNDRNADKAIHNAEEMADKRVDIAIEFQLFEHVAPVIADIFTRARIPVISLVNPHHGSLYLGADNYRAGFSAGIALADYATKRWRGKLDALLLLESPPAGRTVQSRLIGVWRGVESVLGKLQPKAVQHLDSGGDKATSRAAVQEFLRKRTAKKILIAGINDESAIGASQAAEQVDGRNEIAIVGHGGSAEMLELVAKPGSPCIGTVSFHPELYGPELVSFALLTLRGKPTPPAHYIQYEFIGKNARVPSRKAK